MAQNTSNGTENFAAELWVDPPVDWDKWGKRGIVRVWQAAALYCNLPPESIGFKSDTEILDPILRRMPAKVSELINLAKAAIASRTLRVKTLDDTSTENSEVDMTVFASWTCDIGKKPPPEFPWLPEMTLPLRGWPWGSYETVLLRKLALAADRFWKRYDPSDPSTAPTNEQVSDWLKAQGVATRTAEIMATILRADGLSTGPRK